MQYCANEYQAIHKKHGLICSMTDGYDCYQNALAERVNGILKHEFLLHPPEDLHQVRRMVSQSVAIFCVVGGRDEAPRSVSVFPWGKGRVITD